MIIGIMVIYRAERILALVMDGVTHIHTDIIVRSVITHGMMIGVMSDLDITRDIGDIIITIHTIGMVEVAGVTIKTRIIKNVILPNVVVV
jgi:hypothetical protein